MIALLDLLFFKISSEEGLTFFAIELNLFSFWLFIGISFGKFLIFGLKKFLTILSSSE